MLSPAASHVQHERRQLTAVFRLTNEHKVTVETSHPGNHRTRINELKTLSKDLISNLTGAVAPTSTSSIEDLFMRPAFIVSSRNPSQHPRGMCVPYPGGRAPPSEAPAPFLEACEEFRWSSSPLIVSPYSPAREIGGIAHMNTVYCKWQNYAMLMFYSPCLTLGVLSLNIIHTFNTAKSDQEIIIYWNKLFHRTQR